MRTAPRKSWLPPSCPQRIVLLSQTAPAPAALGGAAATVGSVPVAGWGGNLLALVEQVLVTLPPGTTGSEVRQVLREQAALHPGRLLAAEHQGWWHDDSWTRYLWAGAVPPWPAKPPRLPRRGERPAAPKKPKKPKGRKRL